MYFEDVTLGMTLELAPVVIEMDKMLAFAHEYDFIPLHTDEAYAKTTQFGGLIAPGMMSFMTVWAKYLEVELFGPALVAGKSTKVEWLKPVYPGDILTGRVTVSRLEPHGAKKGLVEVSLDAHNQDGVQVLTSATQIIIKRRP